ncbi:flagellar protein [Paenibacillus zeisoli]|uniref:Flagellar protein n=1 Tax=Paenibacillus zeisoli TaxID=2496267 RepID=A0A3S1D8D2_9BACL|nr:flagellar biosynthetic protein FliO [Paenibacillus zeisoli]RUT29723.1 flagellar protein [Paenibacillus zeisoli]
MNLAISDQKGFDSSNFYSSLITVIVVLAVIIVLIVLLIRFLGRRNRFFSKTRSIRTVGAVGLGPNKSLQVIEIGNTVYLIGVGEDISLLDKISDPDEVEVLLSSFEEETPEFGNLTSALSGLVSRFRKEPPSEGEELVETPFHEVFESKLRKLPNRKQQMEELLQDEQTKDR